VSQLVGWSGILALFVFGMSLSHYCWYNLSGVAQISSRLTFRTVAMVAEATVFAYLGLVSATSIGRLEWNIWMISAGMFWILVGRACHVFPIAWLINRIRTTPIDKKMQLMLWFAGMRGAIAFALTFQVPCDNGKPTCHAQEVLMTTTVGIVLITTIVMGTMMEIVAEKLEIAEVPEAETANQTELMPQTMDTIDETLSQLAGPRSLGSKPIPWPSASYGRFVQSCANFDRRVFQPRLGGQVFPAYRNGEKPPETLAEPGNYVAFQEEDVPMFSRSVIFE